MIARLLKSKLDFALWILIGLLAAGAVGLVTHWKLDSGRLKTERVERKAEQQAHAEALAGLESTIKTMKDDAALNRGTIHDLAQRLNSVQPVRPLSVQCFAAMPAAATAAEGGTTGRTDAAAERGSAAPPLRDIGPALEAARVELQSNNARLLTLQEWEAKRTH